MAEIDHCGKKPLGSVSHLRKLLSDEEKSSFVLTSNNQETVSHVVSNSEISASLAITSVDYDANFYMRRADESDVEHLTRTCR